MKTLSMILGLFALAALAGCTGGEPSPLPPGGVPSQAGSQEWQESTAEAPETPAAPQPAAKAAPPISPAASPAETPAPPSSSDTKDYQTVAAKRGVGKKGQGYGGGIITQPIATYFITRDRIAFEVQIPHSMKLYHAQNGRYPKDMEEFESQILKPSGLTLPRLPDGHWYIFDPNQVDLSRGETGLRVARPKE